MPRRVKFPEWAWPDYKRLPGYHAALEAGIHNLARTNWQPAAQLRAALVEIDLWICDRFNLCEQAVLRAQDRDRLASNQDGQPDQPTHGDTFPINQGPLPKTEV